MGLRVVNYTFKDLAPDNGMGKILEGVIDNPQPGSGGDETRNSRITRATLAGNGDAQTFREWETGILVRHCGSAPGFSPSLSLTAITDTLVSRDKIFEPNNIMLSAQLLADEVEPLALCTRGSARRDQALQVRLHALESSLR